MLPSLNDSYFTSGGRFGDKLPLTSSTHIEPYSRWEEYAVESYETIRNFDDDILSIAKNIDWPEYRIKRIKEHLFFKEHQLRYSVGKFDPDPDIADAWARLQRGEQKPSDLRLLEHEYFESKFESIFKTDYDTAHNATLKSGRDWNPN